MTMRPARAHGPALAIALLCAIGAIAAGPPPKPEQPARPSESATTTDHAARARAAEDRAAEEAAREAEKKRLHDEALIRQYEDLERDGQNVGQEPTNKPGATAPSEPSIFGAFVKMVFVLGGVCVLAYLLLGKLLPRLMKIEAPVAKRRIMTVIDRLPLDQRRAILILEIGGAFYLVGASDNGINLLSRLDADEVKQALASAGPSGTAKAEPGRVASLFSRKS